MRITVRAVGIELDDGLRSYVERRLMFALGRFGRRVASARVRLEGLDGPPPRRGKRCSLAARLRGAGHVQVEDTDADLYRAIDRAAGRLDRAVSREIERGRETRASGFGPAGPSRRAREAAEVRRPARLGRVSWPWLSQLKTR